MFIKPVISAPLPWLTFVAARAFGKKTLSPKAAPAAGPAWFPRSLRFTREGKWFTAFLFFTGIAAINTGNNLLYLIVAALLSIIIISGIISESTLRSISVGRKLPSRVFKDAATPVTIRVSNGKRYFPSFSFNVREADCAGLAAEPLYVLKLPAAEGADRGARYVFKRRGRFTLLGMKVSTRFPFGLFLKGKRELVRDTVIVYPSIDPSNIDGLIDHRSFRDEGSSRPEKGSGAQIHGLRDYSFEDDSRRIHWKSAARQSRLLLKEFEREEGKRIYIVFDNYSTPDGARFEALVDAAASLSDHYMKKGFAVGLKTLGQSIPPSSGADHLFRILHTLALIEPAGPGGPAGVRADPF
ncbi:MAG: DUF58 domain-containing protein [Deltaproteobacteria bacterium]|nr:DUF58 domain-containing protein [Deltaproteobacteria bacterium]